MPARITYVGHATVLIELDGVRLLTDPVLRERFLLVSRASAPPAPGTAEEIDAALISHMHADHLDPPSLRELGHATRLIVPPGASKMLERRGFSASTELEPGMSVGVGPVTVTATPAVHDARRWKFGPSREAVGFLVEGPSACVYFAGDTDLHDEMEELRGRVDVALLPIGGWGPRIGEGHLDPQRAAEAAATIAPRIVVPIHWGTFLRADLHRRQPEILTKYPQQLAEAMAGVAPGIELQVLEPGASLSL